MVHDEKTAGIWISPGKHGRFIREKYFDKGEPCPVVVCCGQDPLLFLAGHAAIDHELSEFDYAGGHRGFPFDVIPSELHGLPIPSHAEIAFEGEIYPDETRTEGPFGEFMGYYASEASPQPIIKVRRVYHRNDPILTNVRELLAAGIVDQAGIEELDAEVRDEMSEVARFANDSPLPKAENAMTNVWPQYRA